MANYEPKIESLVELRQYVVQVLCDYDQLEVGAFPVTERILIRSGRACGICFCLHGPRSVKFTAIWETDSNSILFYGPNGERYHRTQLTPMNSSILAA